MYRTIPLLRKGGQRMVSARRGQRRILKRRLPLLLYIEKAVETGIYRTNDEIYAAVRAFKKGDVSQNQPKIAADRFRRDIIRGTMVQDYPAEYNILKQYPPIPPPPKIPKKMLRKMENARERHPTEKLVSNYMKRLDKPRATTEEFYQNLLGIKPPAENFAMGHKSALISKAYAYAVKQWEVMRSQDVSEKEALKIVDDLLGIENQEEAHGSRSIREDLEEWRKNKAANNNSAETDDATGSVQDNLPSILHDKPRVMEGMLQWSHMLQESGIPYSEWTVGASTALDHWIARNILELSEATWDSLLEGNDPNLLGRGQDIVAVRETLFPETRFDIEDDGSDEFHRRRAEDFEEQLERQRDDRAAMSLKQQQQQDPPSSPSSFQDDREDGPREKSVDELLASLRGLSGPSSRGVDQRGDQPQVSGWNNKNATTFDSFEQVDKAVESRTATDEEKKDRGPRDPIQILADELQDWRAMNVKSPYEQWSEMEKQRFSVWLDRYLDILTTDMDRSLVDIEETRIALLSSPPQSEEESEHFWSNIQDERKAEIFLQNLLQKGPPDGLSDDEKEFWSMPYEDQLEKLVNLGTLRPLMDEYMNDKDRVDFMRRYGDYLLDGLEMDHLVPDPMGSITGNDLGAEIIRAWNVQQEDRFSMVKLPYKGGLTGDEEEDEARVEEGETGRDVAMKRSRELYQAWNKHKAGRARYEEQMFTQGDLGLSYETKTANTMEEESIFKHWIEDEDDPVIDPMKPKPKGKNKKK